MAEPIKITEKFRKNYDPTHTTALRNLYARDMIRRFTELIRMITIGVDKNDCFSLRKEKVTINQMTPLRKGAFAFSRDPDKLVRFMEWLQRQVDAGILTVTELEQIGTSVEAMWQNQYLSDSYKRGVIRSRYEMIKAGMNVPSVEASGGVFMIMGLPFHIDRLGLIYTRAYTDLKGITESMDSIISRILAQGIADGDSPALLARKLVASINGEGLGDLGLTDTLGRTISPLRRAELLARTEIIRAHHVAMIQEYRNWGLEGITVMGEWRTAGDERVCEKCASLEGKIFTLDEIEPLIPLHPLCRCIALPYIEELNKYKK